VNYPFSGKDIGVMVMGCQKVLPSELWSWMT